MHASLGLQLDVPDVRKVRPQGSFRCLEHVLPDDGVSVDQIVFAQPGLIPQMSGFLTSRHIWGCTKFCDHVSDFVYVHLMQDYTLDETILGVKAFEKVMAQANRIIKHYHANMVHLLIKVFLRRSIIRLRILLFAPSALIT